MLPQTHESSTFVRHVPCGACGSRDNNAMYSDGHTHCFGCGAHTKGNGPPAPITKRHPVPLDLILDGEPRAIPSRKITQETAEHFGYTVGDYRGKSVQIAPYYNADGQLVAQKIRTAGKEFKVLGDISEALPFGATKFARGGKMLVVTEGEIDAMSVSQVQGNKWPVVSISCGADRPTDDSGTPLPMTKTQKYFAKHRDYFLGFDKVVLMFDGDPAGRASAEVAAKVLGRKAHIAELPLKDANECLKAGKADDIVRALWNARPYRPEGIVDMTTLRETVKQAPARGLSLPFEEWDAVTYGVRLGEIWTFGAGTGIGKTDLFTQLMAHWIEAHGQKIAAFYMEQMPQETATRLAGKLVQKTLHIPDTGWTLADIDQAFDKLTAGSAFLYDGFGANDWNAVKDKIEYLHHAEGVQYVFIDHLTALAAGDGDEERVALERIMSEMGALVKRIPITIFLISHLATPEGKPHEEGGRVTIRHFKGSRAIGFWSHFMFGLERDQQAEEEAVRTTTTLRCLKDRYTGRATGWLMYLGYDRSTGMLFPTTDPETRPAGFIDETPEGGPPSDF